ncbi:nose resistant to fluoxetine protein 6-like [Diabrotica virgifera virgifera]|uniref:Nose resistant to fluoxetine protein 6-like n=1 Tax=Diabrotica virgifera virgifera TaxID=50390 RepID=A0A6P7F1R7_DIAVI|nr:nose resistant to fluoxetine protein 6-like [Diabrotica virgifera virgifera]
MVHYSILILIFLFPINIFCVSTNNLLNPDVIYQWLVPKIGEKNSLCYNHSQFYWNELQDMKLWAAEMFDASGKFPSGVLYGSPYALGNFDQCVDIKVPYSDDPFVGKYCMAKITVTPLAKYKMTEQIDYQFGRYETFFNVSAWSKMLAYQHEDSKASRNEIYFSFCMPSSCTHEDLKEKLTSLAEIINNDFNETILTIDVDQKDCQIREEYKVSTGDAVFIFIVLLCFVIVLGCSIYDMITRDDDRYISRVPGKWHDLFMCFSFPHNLKKLATKTANEDGLECLAGVRVLSMFLIIFGHRCMFTFGSPLTNPIFLEQMYSKFEAAVVLNGPLIVDTFFLVSGFLASYIILLHLKHSSNAVKVGLIYVHRLIRMTPAYAMVLLFYCTVYVSVGSGPFWQERIGVEKNRCVETWWANLAYVNNYVNTENLCMFQSWFITCDMHYFLTVPILVLLLKWNALYGVVTIVALIACSIVVAGSSVYLNNESPILLVYAKLLRDPVSNATFRTIYIPSHMRASPYFLGVLTGFIKYQLKHSSFKLPQWLTRTGWFLAVVVSLGTLHVGYIFYMPEYTKTTIVTAVYAGFHHFTFALGIAWLIIAVSSGKGPWIDPILSWKPFVLLSRLSYTAFLCHGAVQLYTAASLREPSYATVFGTVYVSFGDIVTAYTLGLMLSMFFESPMIGIEKLIFSKNKDPPSLEQDGKATPVIKLSPIAAHGTINNNNEEKPSSACQGSNNIMETPDKHVSRDDTGDHSVDDENKTVIVHTE